MKKSSKPTLLLHSCCAPCLTSVFEQLKDDFDITIFWFNPNIFPIEEYNRRLKELKRYCKIIKTPLIIGDKIPEDANSWHLLTRGLENEIEGGKRCKICIKMRLLYTGKFAEENNFDYFTTTLSISPHKNSYMINNIGKEVASKIYNKSFDSAQDDDKHVVTFLDRDFKKNNGYKRSTEICKEFNIYRQKYCGCGPSMGKIQ